MHHFAYRDGVLHAEAVDLDALAARGRHAVLLLFDRDAERHYKVFAGAFADVDALVCYAMKANSNQAVMATLAKLGAGADVVSGGELKRARAAGVPAEQDHVLRRRQDRATSSPLAIDAGILCINVESEPELELLSAIAAAKGRTANVSVRVNPDIDAKTHAKIATGKAENKFGIPISRAREVYAQAAKLPGRQGRRRRHAHRQPDHRPRSVRRRLCAARRFRARAARRRPRHRARRSRRRARHSLPRRQRAAARSRAYARVVKRATRGLRLQADLRARPADRRQCRRAGDACSVREARRGQDISSWSTPP